jgi:hypothetical protein
MASQHSVFDGFSASQPARFVALRRSTELQLGICLAKRRPRKSRTVVS